MRRWLLLPLVVLALGACGSEDDAEGSDEEPVVTDEVGRAAEVAQLSLPGTLDDDVVARLVADLCTAAGTGDIEAVVAQLVGADIAPAELASSVDALGAGAGTFCPDDVDAVVPQVQQALAPATTTTADATAFDAGERVTADGPSARSSASASSGSGRGGTSSGSASNSSAGSASVGGGNATGTGNSSSTDFTQGATSSNSSSSGGAGGTTTG